MSAQPYHGHSLDKQMLPSPGVLREALKQRDEPPPKNKTEGNVVKQPPGLDPVYLVHCARSNAAQFGVATLS